MSGHSLRDVTRVTHVHKFAGVLQTDYGPQGVDHLHRAHVWFGASALPIVPVSGSILDPISDGVYASFLHVHTVVDGGGKHAGKSVGASCTSIGVRERSFNFLWTRSNNTSRTKGVSDNHSSG